MTVARINDMRLCAQAVLCSALIVMLHISCSPIDEKTGQCKKITEAKYVASSTDTDGKPWKLSIGEESVDLTCDFNETNTPAEGRPSGFLIFAATIEDSQGQAKPGLKVSAGFSGSLEGNVDSLVPGFYSNPFKIREDDSEAIKEYKKKNQDLVDDVATDACGTARFTIRWVCPNAKKSIGASFFVTSGALSSKSRKITLENKVQPDATPTPAR